MTREQLEVLEEWVVAIVADRDRASDLIDCKHRSECKDDVLKVFGLDKE